MQTASVPSWSILGFFSSASGVRRPATSEPQAADEAAVQQAEPGPQVEEMHWLDETAESEAPDDEEPAPEQQEEPGSQEEQDEAAEWEAPSDEVHASEGLQPIEEVFQNQPWEEEHSVLVDSHPQMGGMLQKLRTCMDAEDYACIMHQKAMLDLPHVSAMQAREQIAELDTEILVQEPSADMQPHGLIELERFRKELEKQVAENRDFFGPSGAELHEGLRQILEAHEQGCYGREDVFIQGALSENVREVFHHILSDNSCRNVLFNGYRDKINELTQNIRDDSQTLSENALLPERAAIEESRAQSVYELYNQHRQQEEAVLKKSEVPAILERHLSSFKQKEAQEREQLVALQQQHKRLAADCMALRGKQRQKLHTTEDHCRVKEADAEAQGRKLQAELLAELDIFQEVFTRIQDKLRRIRDEERRARHHMLLRIEVRQLLEVAMRQQKDQAAVHEQTAERYSKGQAVLSHFVAWIEKSYGFLETTFRDKRAQLAQELPEHRRNINAMCFLAEKDLERRKQELVEAMRVQENKMKKKFTDAAAIERIPGQREEALAKKKKGEALKEQLDNMQVAYTQLDQQLLQLKNRPKLQEQLAINGPGTRASGANSTAEREAASRWASSFFYNGAAPAPWETPPALENHRGKRRMMQILDSFLGRNAASPAEEGRRVRQRLALQA